MALSVVPIVADFIAQLDAGIGALAHDSSAAVAAAARPAFLAIVGASWVWFGAKTMLGKVGEPIQDAFLRVFLLSVVLALSVAGGLYSGTVAGFGQRFGDQLGAIMAPGMQARSAADVIDTALARADTISLALRQRGNGWNPADAFSWVALSTIFSFLTACITGLAAGFLIMARLMASLCIAVGPAAILCAYFEPTKNLFSSWLMQTIGFNIAQAFLSCAVSMLFYLWTFSMNIPASAVSGWSACIPAAVLGVAVLLTIWHVPGLAQAIAGGVHLSTMGMFTVIKRGMDGVLSGWSAPGRGSRADLAARHAAIQAAAIRQPAGQGMQMPRAPVAPGLYRP